jgi:hypothetical protein
MSATCCNARLRTLVDNISEFFKISGSVDPANLRARFRTPVEVGWHRMCKFDHDFLGRAATRSRSCSS